MAKICLPKELATRFRQGLKSGEINPDKLSSVTSKERQEFFNKIVGEEYSQTVNSLFESKLLLKNQKQGFITWAKNVAGITPEARRDLLTKIEKMQNILTPETKDQFLNDLVDTKLGISVSDDEARIISSLAKDATEAKAKMETGKRREIGEAPTKEELNYGLKTVALNNYVNNLKIGATRISPREFWREPWKATVELAGITKSLKSSIDVSALLRQGVKTVFSNPKEWLRNAPKTFSDIAKVFRGQEAMDMLNAEIISDPMYDIMKKSKLAVGAIEEAFPTRSPEALPIIGKFFKASDAAYSGFLHRMRFDLFKKYYQIAERNGVNLNSKAELEGIATLVNSLTGRGKLPGVAEPAANLLNVTMFSPRNLQSHIDFLTGLRGRNVSPFAKKQSAIALVKTLAGIGTVLGLSALLLGDKAVETDPRSSDFGKVRYKNTRFDITGGMGSLMTLLARQLTGVSKSSSSGKLYDLNSNKYGSRTRWDVLLDFTENKLSPLAQEAQDRMEGKTFEGDKPTALNTLKNLLAPLSVANVWETKEEKDRANLLVISILEALGIGSSTY